MTSASRRTFATAALASLLVSCGGSPAERTTTERATTPRAGTTSPPARQSANAARALRRSAPVRLRIPAIEVDTPLIRLGLTPDGGVEVPPVTAHDRAGWYQFSPTPGQTGPSVILGHVTVGAYGDGVFRHLDRLRRGDRIEAGLENGTTAVFTVAAVRTVAKAEFPADQVYGDVDRPELRLVTCGGRRTGDGYLDNVIVFATLTSASP